MPNSRRLKRLIRLCSTPLDDEYQDFSPIFDHLITTLRRHNPALQLFCVGDDWQAINSFAGANLSYFTTFAQQPGAAETLLHTNHRSRKAIVDIGNKLMANHGPVARALSTTQPGHIVLHCLDKLWLDLGLPQDDNRFRPRKPNGEDGFVWDDGFMTTRFLKYCYLILSQMEPDQTVAILARTNTLYGLDLTELKDELCKHLDASYAARLHLSTVHSYKGQEADLVILANITSDAFPLIHSDTELCAPLYPGIDLQAHSLAEERRLFYVALTRAKQRLWIVTETDQLSPFLADLRLPIQLITEAAKWNPKPATIAPTPTITPTVPPKPQTKKALVPTLTPA